MYLAELGGGGGYGLISLSSCHTSTDPPADPPTDSSSAFCVCTACAFYTLLLLNRPIHRPIHRPICACTLLSLSGSGRASFDACACAFCTLLSLSRPIHRPTHRTICACALSSLSRSCCAFCTCASFVLLKTANKRCTSPKCTTCGSETKARKRSCTTKAGDVGDRIGGSAGGSTGGSAGGSVGLFSHSHSRFLSPFCGFAADQ